MLEHGEQHVKHREPSEGAVNVTLTFATFWVEGELLNSGEALKVPELHGEGGAYYGLSGIVKVDKPRRCQRNRVRGWDTELNAFFMSQNHP